VLGSLQGAPLTSLHLDRHRDSRSTASSSAQRVLTPCRSSFRRCCHHRSLSTPEASAFRLPLPAEFSCPALRPPCGFSMRRTLKDRSAAAVRLGFIRAHRARLPSTAASRRRRRSGGTACARLARSLVASSFLKPAPFGCAQTCASPPAFHLRLATPASRRLDDACPFATQPAASSRLESCDPFRSIAAGPPPPLPACAFQLGECPLLSVPLSFPELSRAPTRLPGCPFQRARSTSTPSGSRLPACCCWLPFRLAPSSSPRPRCFRLLRRTDGHLGALHHHARLLRPPLRRLAPTVGETSVRSLLAALANDVSTALSRARFHAPLLRAARLFGPSDSSDSPCPFTRTLWA
jgi:hypothetical protein